MNNYLFSSGLGSFKAQRFDQAFNQPFKRQKQRMEEILMMNNLIDQVLIKVFEENILFQIKIGDHILVDEKSPATIRYIGLVDDHPGEWIGIEWWNQQGKHNGIFKGKFDFQTKHPLTGAFIRPSRIQIGHSFTEAIYRQYVKAFSNEHVKDEY